MRLSLPVRVVQRASPRLAFPTAVLVVHSGRERRLTWWGKGDTSPEGLFVGQFPHYRPVLKASIHVYYTRSALLHVSVTGTVHDHNMKSDIHQLKNQLRKGLLHL